MALTDKQIAELNATYTRPGGQTATDLTNIKYAVTQGYQPPKPKDLIGAGIADVTKSIQSKTTVPSSLPGSAITTPAPTPSPTPTPPPVDPFVTSLEASNKQLQDYIDKAYQPVQEIQKEKTGLQDKLLSAIEKLGGKGQALVQQEETLGVPIQVQQLSELNTQIAQKTGEFNKSIENLSAGTGLTTTIAGKQGQLRRQQAVEVGALTSLAQAVQGNISLAQQTAQRTVELEFAPVETEIQTLGVQIDNIYNDLTSAEKKAADKLKAQLDERTRLLDEQKTERTNVLNLGAQMAQNGASNDVLTKVSQAKTIEEALQIGGTFLKTPEKPQTSVIEANGRQLLINNQTGATIKDLGAVTVNAPQNIGTDANGNDLYYDPTTKKVVTAEQLSGSGQIENAGAEQIAAAIKQVESGGNYNAKGASGEFGAYQFMPGTWKSWSNEYATANNINQSLAPNQQNQDAVAKFKINQWLTQGLTPQEIAAKWNSGSEVGWENKIGVNSKGVPYNVPAYVNKVTSALGSIVAKESPVSNNLTEALNIITGSSKLTKDQKKSLEQAIQTGQDPFTVVKNQAKNIMGQTEANGLTKFEVAKSQIEDLQVLLNQYYENGGKTSVFSGNYEKVINKLGEVKDPVLVSIATNIQSALQIYRNAVSGTAYSEQEGQDIASIFPGINKTQGLNEAIIKGRLQAFDSTIDSTYRSALGEVYDKLKQQNQTDKPGLDSFVDTSLSNSPLSSFIR